MEEDQVWTEKNTSIEGRELTLDKGDPGLTTGLKKPDRQKKMNIRNPRLDNKSLY